MNHKNRDWFKLWEKGQAGWHKHNVNKYLLKNSHHLGSMQESLKILIPLCGKSLDIKYLSDLGHVVVGVEIVEKPIKDFFDENAIEYYVDVSKEKQCKIYSSLNKQIKIFCSDFFNFDASCAGLFDVIWDRCAFSAIEISDRENYCNIIKSVLAPNFKYLLDFLNYEQSFRSVPPYAMTTDFVEGLFRKDMEVTFNLLEEDYIKIENFRGGGGYGPWIAEYILLISNKS